MHKKKVIFLGSKPIGYECFAYLIAQQELLNVAIVGLLTQKRKEFGNDHDLAALAETHNIPVLNSLAELPSCDIMYSVQYHEILKQEHIDKAVVGAVNLHMAPLPEYRGSNQFSFAILDKKEEFGTTIHKIDTRIDHGDILFQKRFPIPDNCWVEELYQLTFNASLNLFKQTLKHIINGQYQPLPQAHLEGKYGTNLHFRNEMASIKQIDLNWDDEQISRHIRATSMPGFEPPYCIVNGEKVYFSRKW
jgi:methionyl-tRNA formyltransferase